MKIGPLDSGERPHRPEEERRRVDVDSDAQRRMNQTDRIEISSEARSLSEMTSPDEIGEAPPADRIEISNEIRDLENRLDKIEEANERIESGYYESVEVKEEIARRITDDFLG